MLDLGSVCLDHEDVPAAACQPVADSAADTTGANNGDRRCGGLIHGGDQAQMARMLLCDSGLSDLQARFTSCDENSALDR